MGLTVAAEITGAGLRMVQEDLCWVVRVAYLAETGDAVLEELFERLQRSNLLILLLVLRILATDSVTQCSVNFLSLFESFLKFLDSITFVNWGLIKVRILLLNFNCF
jgi:hypothetical protein